MTTTDDKIAAARAAYVSAQGHLLDHYMARNCESPIEQLFLATLLSTGWRFASGFDWRYAIDDHAKHGIAMNAAIFTCDEAVAVCVPQAEVRAAGHAYRIDFAFVSDEAKIAVELDGHDFHERTKEQAARDKARDRALTTAGWRVVRFAGSEVYADAAKCLAEVMRLEWSLYEQHIKPRPEP